MASSDNPGPLGNTLIDFSTNGIFPGEEAISSARVKDSSLSAALAALINAKAELESEVRHISQESASNVDSWISNAQSIQDDLETSRQLASQIVRQAEADETRLEELENSSNYVMFMTKEVELNAHLLQALQELQKLNEQLDKAEILAAESDIMAALRVLGVAWETIQTVPQDTTVRAMKILDQRCFDLTSSVHKSFEVVWGRLVVVNMDDRVITINQTVPIASMSLSEATTALQAYKELDKTANELWENLDDAILKPRTVPRIGLLPQIEIKNNSIRVGEEVADSKIKTLFIELEDVIRFLIKNLTPELVKSLSDAMMPTLSKRVKELWLDTAVPASLAEIEHYQKALVQVSEFASTLDNLNWPHTHGFHRWVEDAHKNWLNKKRETVLDWTRSQLSLGLGKPRPAERVQTKRVPRDQGKQIAANGNKVDEWDAAWDSDKEDSSMAEAEHTSVENGPEASSERNRASLEEERRHSSVSSGTPIILPGADDDDDPTDAWGWNEEDAPEEAVEDSVTSELAKASAEAATAGQDSGPDLHQVTVTEKILISSFPSLILQAVVGVLNDGAILTQPTNEALPISPAAPGLFNLPTLILAEYRALSPTYYSENKNGNMYLLNDAIWLSDQLKVFADQWKKREDVPERASRMIKLDSEITKLISFGNRAYTNELVAQRTIINDLLASSQNFLQQDKTEIKEGIRFVIKLIRNLNWEWSKILPWSACASATGSLVNTVSSKLIADTLELSTIGVDEAEHIATIISQVEGLDDLFVKPGSQQNGLNATPLTGQFVEKWFKLRFLSQVLQSNLRDIKYMWTDSDLSYYFTLEEVEDLILMSFEDNSNARQTIRDIRANLSPRAGFE